MAQSKRRYTTVDGTKDYIVTASFADVSSEHWFEVQVDVIDEGSGARLRLPAELATYRVGEIEHRFRDIVRLDFGGDPEAAVDHILATLFRRIYTFIERGH